MDQASGLKFQPLSIMFRRLAGREPGLKSGQRARISSTWPHDFRASSSSRADHALFYRSIYGAERLQKLKISHL